MISDRDIYSAANQFIEQHGGVAAIEAEIRADALGAKSDFDGQRVWLRIIEAIKQLQRARSPGEPVN